MNRAGLLVAILMAPLFAGCVNPFASDKPAVAYTSLDGYRRDATGNDPNAWPDLGGETLTILDNGAFPACTAPAGESAAAIFEKLTSVKVTCENGGDAGTALKKLIDAKRGGTYDVIYGLDNALLARAERDSLLDAYKPKLHDRIDPALIFFGADTSAINWTATPVDHGYVAINVDQDFAPNGTKVLGIPIDNLAKVRLYSDQFVTPDPANSSPGLAFLLITIAKFGDQVSGSTPIYDWHAYWRDLFRGTNRPGAAKEFPCVLIAKDWTDAYANHFSGGYGAATGLADKPIVTSYTESPAYEAYFGRNTSKLAKVITSDGSTWHQIQTMAIANGTKHAQAAQAWIEFTLTDKFQELAAPQDAVYPVVSSVSVEATYAGLDPAPNSLRPATLDYKLIGANLDRWLLEWRKLAEDGTNNCRA